MTIDMQKIQLRNLITCAIKTGTIDFTKPEGTDSVVATVAGKELHLADCDMDGKDTSDVTVRLLNDPTYRILVTDKLEHRINHMDEGNDKQEILKALNDAYIQPDDRLHLCVGFYLNGDFKTNTVPGKSLPDNIEYNRHMRPGRFYYVDGEYMCGGMLKSEFMPGKIAEHKARITERDLRPANHDTAPYQ